ncbi:hypothetical protein P43SY_003156 [Pythium insidiosum]|uniref:Eukaryotic translation initiation factor 3 subunit B n=1 Tax=Pythium insidiosum TaxID=114742 RepID=A0AAD5L7V8_PYTIN|nr:hypothetical protein P43SY_003156 [Pythium insidiosum]
MAPPSFEQRLASLRKEAEQYADYLSDEEVEDEVATQKHEEDDFCHDFSMCVVVGGLPVIDNSKHGKLLNVVKKIFSQVGAVVDIDMPFGANGMTTGFAFVEFEQEAHAADAVRTINNFALDKRHTLLVNKYEDLHKFESTPAEFVAPKVDKFVEPKNLKTWLTDSARRDMFALRHGTETEIFWSDKGEISLDYAGDREKQNGKQWCSQYVLWSPQGTYFATFHPQGVALWAGEHYEKVGRFAHRNVKIAVFSPNENYLITLSESEVDNAIVVWEVKTGKLLRSFPLGKPTGEKGEVVQGIMTPFKWSADDRFVARRGKDVISVYELPSMKLLDKKSLKADGVHDFFWSPTDPVLAYWAPEGNNVPARVSLVELPSRRELRQKNLFNVSDCKLQWHPNGTFLSVKVTRHSKSKKTLFTNFELFRLRESLVPVEMLEMKETIVAFAFEPKGTRFAVVHGEGNQRLNVSFYDMHGGTKKNELTLLYTLADKPCSHLYWSPHGNNIVLAGLGEINGVLEFWDTDEKQSITIQEHFKCTHVEWDPSGRVVMSAVCQPIDNSYYKFQMDNGFTLWTFQGKKLLEEKKDAFYQFLWRPRPRNLLSDEEYADVVKNLKKYERRFNEMDRLKERERVAAEKAEKQRQVTEFTELVKSRQAAARALRQEYIALLGGYDSEDEDEYIVQSRTFDDVISESEEVVRKRDSVLVLLSPRWQLVCWLLVVAVNIVAGLFLYFAARLLRFLRDPDVDYYLRLIDASVTQSQLIYFSAVYAALSMVFWLEALRLLVVSLVSRRLSLAGLPTSTDVTATARRFRRRQATFEPFASRASRVLKRMSFDLFSDHGLLGIKSDYFSKVQAARKLIQIVSQLYQAARVSRLVSREHVNWSLLVIIIFNCISTPLILKFMQRKTGLLRALCMACDIISGMASAVIIPVTILLPYYWAWDHDAMGYSDQLLYDDVWFITAVMETRLLISTTWIDLAFKIYPFIECLICLNCIKAILHSKKSDSEPMRQRKIYRPAPSRS